MQLRLIVVRDPRRVLGERTAHGFGEEGGTIGRNGACNLVLADGGNVISSRHAEIGFNGRGFTITDTSTNGVYVNHTGAPLGRGNSLVLTPGDLIYIGELVFKVEIQDDARDGRARLGLPTGEGWTQARSNPPASAPPASLEDLAGSRQAPTTDPLAGFAPSAPVAPSAKPAGAARDPLAGLNVSEDAEDDLAGPIPTQAANSTLFPELSPRPGMAPARPIPPSFTLTGDAQQPMAPRPNPPAVEYRRRSAPAPISPLPVEAIPDLNAPIAPQAPAILPPLPFAQEAPLQSPIPGAPLLPMDADFLAPAASPARATPPAPPIQPLATPSISQPLSQPLAPSPQAPLIPDDFAAHLMGLPGFSPDTSAPAAPAGSSPVPESASPMPAAPLQQAVPVQPAGSPPLPGQRAPLRPDFAASFVTLRRKEDATPASAPALDPVSVLRKRSEARPIAEATRINTPRPAAAQPAAPASAGPAPRSSGDLTTSRRSDELAIFWQALGIDPAQIDPARRAAILQILAATIQESIGGLIEVLSARTAIKDEFRMDQTQIQPEENNPLKFFRSGEETLRRAVVAGQPGFLNLDVATRLAFNDIKAHEVAAMTAMQRAIPRLLQRLSPVAIEEVASPARFGRKPDKAKLWDQFVELYNQYAERLEFTIPEIIAKEFARVYREQIDQMNQGGQK
ncbi:MAG: type VI secretion system-associated FHA domain protein TagH [Methylovirgula sp.]